MSSSETTRCPKCGWIQNDGCFDAGGAYVPCAGCLVARVVERAEKAEKVVTRLHFLRNRTEGAYVMILCSNPSPDPHNQPDCAIEIYPNRAGQWQPERFAGATVEECLRQAAEAAGFARSFIAQSS